MKQLIILFMISATILFAQTEKWVKQINEINEVMIESVMNKTPEKTLMFYVDDAVSMPSYTPMMIGRDAMLKSAKEDQDDNVKWLSFDLNTKYIWESGNFVIEIGTYKYAMEIAMMPEPFEDVGKYMTVYEVQDNGSLKIKADTWNTDLNPWATMAPPPSPQEEMQPKDKE